MPHNYYMARHADRFPVFKWLREHLGRSDEDRFYASFLNWCSFIVDKNIKRERLPEGGERALACLRKYPTAVDELLLIMEHYRDREYRNGKQAKGVVPNWDGEEKIAASDIRAGELALYQRAATFLLRGEHLHVKQMLEQTGAAGVPALPKQSASDKLKYKKAKKEAAEGLLAMSTGTGGVDLAKNKKVEATLEMADVGAALPADEDNDNDNDEQLPVTTQSFNFNNLANRTR